MRQNPLAEAVFKFDDLMDAHSEIIHDLGGCDAFSDDALHDAVGDVITEAWNACYNLSPRARRARVNLIWEDFRKRHQRVRSCDGRHAV